MQKNKSFELMSSIHHSKEINSKKKMNELTISKSDGYKLIVQKNQMISVLKRSVLKKSFKEEF